MSWKQPDLPGPTDRARLIPILVAALVLGTLTCSLFEPAGEWRRTYNLGFAEPVVLVPRADSGFTLCCWRSSGYDGSRVLLVRCNSDGDTLWTRYPLKQMRVNLMAASAAPDGGFYVGGDDYDSFAGFVARLDDFGRTVWLRRFTGELWPILHVYSVAQASDGGVLVAGRDAQVAPFACRLSATGESLWSRAYPDSSIVYTNAVCPASDGWFLAGCAADYRAFVRRVDNQGEPVWFWRHDGDTMMTSFKSVIPLPDGGALACGERWDESGPISSGILVRLNAHGRETWCRVVQGQWYTQVVPHGSDFVVVGSVKEGWNYRVALSLVNASGDLLDFKEFSGTEDDYGHNVISAGDGVIATGCYWPSKRFDIIRTRFQ